MLLMRRMRNFAQVKLRKKNKNKGLNEGNKDAQRHKQYWNQPVGNVRIETGNCVGHFFVGKHVAEETYSQGKRTDEVADQLNGKNQP